MHGRYEEARHPPGGASGRYHFSSDGVFADPPGFLRPAVDAVRAEGALFIADEVQPGFGRCGEQMWGFARHGLVPDLVTMGKPMGNGHPVAGMARVRSCWRSLAARRATSTPSAATRYRRRRHCGARRDRDRRADAERATHRWLSNQVLMEVQARHALIAEVRGAGYSSVSSCGTADRRARLPRRKPRGS
jgi:4-aminobutyrate aminotransferase-like enzyme